MSRLFSWRDGDKYTNLNYGEIDQMSESKDPAIIAEEMAERLEAGSTKSRERHEEREELIFPPPRSDSHTPYRDSHPNFA